jgi:hypothetical protein
VKYETYSEYNPQSMAFSEGALLTIWPILDQWHDNLVLVGGLVPRYICGDVASARDLPRPVTMDADLGIALGASAGGMSSLKMTLADAQFRQSKSAEGLIRYEKQVGQFSVPLDFLTDAPPHTHGSASVDDIIANVLPGVDRALKISRWTKIKGNDLAGQPQSASVRVCEVGPFLAMKLRAFARRQAPKDVFDILYTLLHYDRGTNAAVTAFGEEVRVGNPACPDAVACLNQHFRDEQSSAPIRAASFILGQAAPGESKDIRFRRLQIQQDMVDAGRLLRAVTPATG